jgi:hypothetical protein
MHIVIHFGHGYWLHFFRLVKACPVDKYADCFISPDLNTTMANGMTIIFSSTVGEAEIIVTQKK